MKRGFPRAYPGLRIGLLGGTFDPAHEGHAHIAQVALARLGLDRVWWLVTPQNPLKPRAAPLAARLASARRYARARMEVTDLESRLGLAYTIDTARALQARFPAARFVLILGGDTLASLHRWRRWGDLMRMLPVAIVSRPTARGGPDPGALGAKPLLRFASARVPAHGARAFTVRSAPAWIYLAARFSSASSTVLRRRRGGAGAAVLSKGRNRAMEG